MMKPSSFLSLIAVARVMGLSTDGPPPYDRRYWPPALSAGASTPPKPLPRNPISSLAARVARSLVSPRENEFEQASIAPPLPPPLVEPNPPNSVEPAPFIQDEMRDIILESQAEVRQARRWAQQEVAVAYAEAEQQAMARNTAEQEWAYAENEAKAAAAKVVEVSTEMQELRRQLEAAQMSNRSISKLEELLIQETARVSMLEAEIEEVRSDAARQIAEGLVDARAVAMREAAAVESESYSARARAAEDSARALKLQRELDAIKGMNSTASSESKWAADQKVIELQVEVKALKAELVEQAKTADEKVRDVQNATAASLHELQTSYAAAQKREMELKASLAAASKNSTALEMRLLELQKELDVAKATGEEKAVEAESYHKQFIELQSEVEDLKRDGATGAESRAKAEADAAARAEAAREADEARVKAEQLAKAAEADSKAATARAAEASAKVAQLQRDLDAALVNASKIASLENANRSLTAEVAAGSAVAAKLQAEVEALKKELVSETLDAASAKTAADEAVVALKANLQPLMDAQSAMAATLGAQVLELEAELEEVQGRESLLHESWTALHRDNEEATYQINSTQKQLTAAHDVIETLAAQSDELAQKLALAEIDSSQLRAQLDDKHYNGAAADDANSSLKAELAAQINRSEAAESASTSLRTQLDDQIRRNQVLDNTVTTLRAQLAAQSNKIQAAEKHVASLNVRLSAGPSMGDVTVGTLTVSPLGERAQKLEESLMAAYVQKQDLQKSLMAMSDGMNEETKALTSALRQEFDIANAEATKADSKAIELREKLSQVEETLRHQTKQLEMHEATTAAENARFPATAAGQTVAKAAAAKAAADLTLMRARAKQEFAKAESESKAADAWAAELSSKAFNLQRDLLSAQAASSDTPVGNAVARSEMEAQVTEAEKLVERLQEEVNELKKDLSKEIAGGKAAAPKVTESIHTRNFFRRQSPREDTVEDLNRDLAAQAEASEAAVLLAQSVKARKSNRRRPRQDAALETKKLHTRMQKRRPITAFLVRLAVLAVLSSLGVISVFDVTLE